jgi:DNA-binding NarL/FixJ family response regulator
VIVVEPMVPLGGIALIRALRHESSCPDAALVVVTTLASAAVRRHALEAGADAYLIKPCGMLTMGEAIANASRDRLRLIVPRSGGATPSRTRLRQVVRRCRAIRERLTAS